MKMKRVITVLVSLTMMLTPIHMVMGEDSDMSDKQKNSISMLNHLAVLTQEINDSKNSRLYLEEAISSLVSNTHPNAVDPTTQSYLSSLLDTLEGYRMISVKRDRLQYIYEQNQAQAIKQAIPNPIGLLSATKSKSLPQLIGSVVYMAVDSAVSYKTAMDEASFEYLQSGWELDDEEAENLHNSRKSAFAYMLNIVRDYDLEGDLALSEEAVQEYSYWKNHSNLAQKITFFESNKDTYKAYGDYWLTLASAYYQNEDYDKCIECIESFQALNAHIFRKDRTFAKTLPLAIISAGEVMEQEEAIPKVESWLKLLCDNTDEKDWALRYYAAQAYLDLSRQTGNEEFIKTAYNIIRDNVNYLVNEQRTKNKEYLAEVQKVETPDGATKAEKSEIKDLNKMLEEEREKALPPVYEPFIINCDFLFELIKELEISQAERKRINGILHENGEPIFLVDVLDSRYWISTDADDYSFGKDLQYQSFSTEFDGDDLTIPVFMASDDAVITVTVEDDDGTVFDDWTIDEVERKDESDYSSFMATFHSEKAEDYKYSEGTRIHIEVIPKADLAKKKYKYDMEVTDITESRVRIPPFTTLIDDITFEVVQE